MSGKETKPCCLLVSLLASDESTRLEIIKRLSARFGVPAFVSAPLPFDYTDYYTAEMGAKLNRRFLVFKNLVDGRRLPYVKLHCISLEEDFSVNGRRMVNIDPGTLSAENFVLATTKAAGHRLPLGAGIYGELTLLFSHGAYKPLPWTYPDYASPLYGGLMLGWRRRYLWQLGQLSYLQTVLGKENP